MPKIYLGSDITEVWSHQGMDARIRVVVVNHAFVPPKGEGT
jgi:hypothetical protein